MCKCRKAKAEKKEGSDCFRERNKSAIEMTCREKKRERERSIEEKAKGNP